MDPIIRKSRLISIHTPAKGVTLPAIVFVVGLDISIHTPAKGVTYDAYQFFSFHLISIHTPAKGVTILPPILTSLSADFNPHSREGSDGLTASHIQA